jgi:hypothetical protein
MFAVLIDLEFLESRLFRPILAGTDG